MKSFTSSPSLPSLTKRKAIVGLAAAHATASRAPSLILPRLYLANWTIADNEALLVELGITHVVSALEFPPEYTGGSIKTLHVKVEDTFRTDILRHLDGTTAFIKEALEENETNKVLVHCLMGISRSATVVCAYLIATTPMTAPEAIAFVTERRPVASPNVGFRRQLEAYAVQYKAPETATCGVMNSIADRMRKLQVKSESGKPQEQRTSPEKERVVEAIST